MTDDIAVENAPGVGLELQDRRTLEGWSAVAGASARTLARLFERDLAMSFDSWRRRIRFQGALEALSRGEPIARVARNHGYRSASAFSQAFARVMGKPPSKLARKPNRHPLRKRA